MAWVVIVLSTLVLGTIVNWALGQWKLIQANTQKAKAIGLPYTITPVFMQNPYWNLLQPLVLPVLQKLPASTTKWLRVSVFSQAWHQGHKPFENAKGDTFTVVSPMGCAVWTCDPAVISQVLSRKGDFPKFTPALQVLNIFGPTITGTEGTETRLYRKITSATFTESQNQAVWQTTLKEVAAMSQDWEQQSAGGSVVTVNQDAANLSLHILSTVSYGRPMTWHDKVDEHSAPAGRSLTYAQAIHQVLEHVPIIFTSSKNVLMHRRARQAFNEWRQYMVDMRNETRALDEKTPERRHTNLIEKEPREANDDKISFEAVLGNIFIFTLAGHETSANTLVYAIYMLVLKAELQDALQAELDTLLQGRDPEHMTYEEDFAPLQAGLPGAILSEVLRLYTVLPFFPKWTGPSAQALTVDDQTYQLPPFTALLINTSATHRHPRQWQRQPSSKGSGGSELIAGEQAPFPVSDFQPSRWLNNAARPTAGSYIPFSEGPRACLGRKFATVEFLAALALLFARYRIDLAPGVSRDQAAYELSGGIHFRMALKMSKPIPIRVTRRHPQRS